MLPSFETCCLAAQQEVFSLEAESVLVVKAIRLATNVPVHVVSL